jgi:hypothetical protein
MKVFDVIRMYEAQIVQIAKFWGFPEISICSPISDSTEGHLNLLVTSSQDVSFGNISLLNEELESVCKCAVTVFDANSVGSYVLNNIDIVGLNGHGTKNLSEMENTLGTEYFHQELDQCHLYDGKSPPEIATLQATFAMLKEARTRELQARVLSQQTQQQLTLSGNSFFLPQQRTEQKASGSDVLMTELTPSSKVCSSSS